MTQPGRPGDIGPVPSEQSRADSTWADSTWADSSWAARVSLGAHQEITAYRYLDVWLIEVSSGRPVATDAIDLAIQLALAENPRGVVCDVADTSLPAADLRQLGRTGRHVESWPAVPLLFVCRDDARWAEIQRQPEARFLVRSTSLLHAWSLLHGLPEDRHVSATLPPDARAARAARQFLSRACEDWATPQHLSTGPLVVSELVANAVEHTDGPVDVHLAEHDGELRIGVRDHADRPPVTRDEDPDATSGRGLRIVQSLSRATGALPAAGGGKLVWAVLADDSVSAPA